MKKKAEELKLKLENITVTEEKHGITVDCNGNRKILAIHIPEDQLQDKIKLEENLRDAVNHTLASAEKAAFGDMAGMMGGLSSLLGK